MIINSLVSLYVHNFSLRTLRPLLVVCVRGAGIGPADLAMSDQFF